MTDLRETAKLQSRHGRAMFLAWVDEENLDDCLEEFALLAMESALEWAAHVCDVKAEERLKMAPGGRMDSYNEGRFDGYESVAKVIRAEAARLREVKP